MAYLSTERCLDCDRKTRHINGKCAECSGKKADRARREHFGKLNALTVEERIRLLEEWQYTQQLNPPWVEPTY